MSLITITPFDRRTEIKFSRTLKIDFDNALKNALESLNIRVQFQYSYDTDFMALYKLNKRLFIGQRTSLEGRLYQIAGLELPKKEKRKNKDYSKFKTETFMGTSKTKTDIICGFIGNYVCGHFEFLYS